MSGVICDRRIAARVKGKVHKMIQELKKFAIWRES